MQNNKTALAGLVGGVVYFLLGWIIYGLILMDMMESQSTMNIMRDESDMVWWALILGNLSYGFLLAYVFGNWAGIKTAVGGAKGGAILGAFMAVGFDLVMYATADIMTLTGALVDIVVWIVISAGAGAAVGWMLGRGSE